MDIKDILPVPDLENCKSLLCIQPHPDDNEIGAGATIAKLARRGCDITYLTVTDGSMGTADANAKPEDIASIRKKEAKNSAALLGVSNTIFLNYPDGGYPDEKLLCQSIVRVIRAIRPQMVLAPDPFLPYEAHPDHRRTGMAAAEACIFSQFPGFKTGGSDEPAAWAVQGVVFHSTAYPNTWIGIDDTWDLKLKAIAIHESQFSGAVLERLGMYLGFKAMQYAAGKPFQMAEAFKVLSGDHLHMNVDTIHL